MRDHSGYVEKDRHEAMQDVLKLWGAEPLRYPIIPDNWEQLERTLADAAAKADIVVINAGSSKGSDDFTCEILQKNGRMLHHMLA